MNGYANMRNKTVVFDYEYNTLTLLLDTISKTEQTSYVDANMTLPEESNILWGMILPLIIGMSFS